MPLDPRRIALALWSLRRHLTTPDELTETLSRVRQLGFQRVELGGLPPLPPRELRRRLDDAGLGACGSLEDPGQVLAEPTEVAERLELLGCRLAVCPLPNVPLTSRAELAALADALSRSGERLRSRGRLLAYQPRARDFRKLEGRTILDGLLELSDPFMLHAELDTYAVQLGGGDPAAYAARLSGRLPCLQLTDYAIGDAEQPRSAALGDGNLNFRVILREAEAAACELYVVKQDPAPELDAFAEVEKSLRYLTSA